MKSAHQQYAFLNVLDQQTFDTLKVSGSASGSYYGLVSGSANFAEFKQKREAFFQKVGYSSSAAQSESELRVTTSDAAYRAFATCMETLARNTYGFFAFKVGETSTAVIVQYIYHPTPGVTAALPLRGTVVNGSVPGLPPGQLFPIGAAVVANGSGTVQVQRVRSKGAGIFKSSCAGTAPPAEMSIAINAPGHSAAIVSAWREQRNSVSGNALVVLTRTSVTEEISQALSAMSGSTENNDNRRCDRPPCSSDGKFRATRVELTIAAPAGSTLRNPRITCESSADPGVCGHVAVDALDVRDNGRQAYLSLRASSRPARFTLWADPVIRKVASADEAQPSQELQQCGLATFQVAKAPDITGALIRGNFPEGQVVIRPGVSSTDGRLLFLDKVETPSSSYFMYRVAR